MARSHQIRVSVSRACAARAGQDSWGDVVVPVRVADLTQAQRETLASLRATHDGISDASEYGLDLTGSETPAEILERVAAHRAAEAEKRIQDWVICATDLLSRYRLVPEDITVGPAGFALRDGLPPGYLAVCIGHRYLDGWKIANTATIELSDSSLRRPPAGAVDRLPPEAAVRYAALTDDISALKARCAELQPQVDAILAERDRKIADKKAELEAKRAAEEAKRLAWIAAHGSERLQLAVKLGVEYDRIYRDERLAIDRPGWTYDEPDGKEPRNPPIEALRALEDARATRPEVALVYVPSRTEEDEETGDSVEYEAYYVLTDSFLGRTITRRVS
jgi:hypothetical protein